MLNIRIRNPRSPRPFVVRLKIRHRPASPSFHTKKLFAMPVLIALVFFAALSLPGRAGTLPPARFLVKVVDVLGEPLAEVKVRITHQKQSDYLQTKVTGKRGKFLFLVQGPALFEDCFLLSFEAVGYQEREVFQRLVPGQSVRKTVTLFQEDAVVYHEQGLAAVLSGNISAAEGLFLKALSLRPSLAGPRNALVEIYLTQERYDEAAKLTHGAPGTPEEVDELAEFSNEEEMP